MADDLESRITAHRQKIGACLDELAKLLNDAHASENLITRFSVTIDNTTGKYAVQQLVLLKEF
jgi:hypothetical protein